VFSFAFLGQNAGIMDYMRIAVILTAGTAFVLWLGDQITQKGIGNGVSLIIMAGIIANLPNMFFTAFEQLVKFTSTQATVIGFVSYFIFVFVYLLIVVGVVFIQQAERRIPIQYANRTTSAYGGQQTYMPIKINSGGVIPIIFASVLVTIPATLAQFVNNEKFTLFVEKYVNYDTTTGFIFYLACVLFFAYFYTFMQLNPKELSDNLNKNGGYIPGIKPGKETDGYIRKVLSRLTLLGGTFLMIIAGLPILFTGLSHLPSSVRVGGTGLLIVVGVALETYNQIQSQLIGRDYKRSYK
jgi:preprotein translocase subunit SecY